MTGDGVVGRYPELKRGDPEFFAYASMTHLVDTTWDTEQKMWGDFSFVAHGTNETIHANVAPFRLVPVTYQFL